MKTYELFEEGKFKKVQRLEREYVEAHENDIDLSVHSFKTTDSIYGDVVYLSDADCIAQLKKELAICFKMWKFVEWFSKSFGVPTYNAGIFLYDAADGTYYFELTLDGAKVMRSIELATKMLEKHAQKKWDEFVPEVSVTRISPRKVTKKHVVFHGFIRARTPEARKVVLKPINPETEDAYIAAYMNNYRHTRLEAWRGELRQKFRKEYEGN